MIFKQVKLLILLTILSVNSAFATDKGAIGEIPETVKEIFLKGSINDDSLFLVLGLEDAHDVSKNILKHAVDLETLKDIGGDTGRAIRNTGRQIYNRNHDGDIIDDISEAGKFTVENAENIFKTPWRSLSKIPGAHRAIMGQARDARANSTNEAAGLLKYSGLAVYAKFKGAYFLVIEAPVLFLSELAATSLAVPATLLYNAVSIPLGFTVKVGAQVLRLGWQATKGVLAGAVSLGVIGYSAVSTSIAATVTTSAYLLSGAVKISIKALSLPFKLGQKARSSLQTAINYKKLEALSEFIANYKLSADDKKLLMIENSDKNSIAQYKSTIEFTSLIKEKKKAFTLKALIDWNADKTKQNINLVSYFSNKHFSALKKSSSLSNSELKELLINNTTTILNRIINEFTQGEAQ